MQPAYWVYTAQLTVMVGFITSTPLQPLAVGESAPLLISLQSRNTTTHVLQRWRPNYLPSSDQGGHKAESAVQHKITLTPIEQGRKLPDQWRRQILDILNYESFK